MVSTYFNWFVVGCRWSRGLETTHSFCLDSSLFKMVSGSEIVIFGKKYEVSRAAQVSQLYWNWSQFFGIHSTLFLLHRFIIIKLGFSK